MPSGPFLWSPSSSLCLAYDCLRRSVYFRGAIALTIHLVELDHFAEGGPGSVLLVHGHLADNLLLGTARALVAASHFLRGLPLGPLKRVVHKVVRDDGLAEGDNLICVLCVDHGLLDCQSDLVSEDLFALDVLRHIQTQFKLI
jgi:hypothetical protein